MIDVVPAEETRGYDMHTVIDCLVDAESFFEVKPLFAPELIIGFALMDGSVWCLGWNAYGQLGMGTHTGVITQSVSQVNLCP